jgi:hypothetical protein
LFLPVKLRCAKYSITAFFQLAMAIFAHTKKRRTNKEQLFEYTQNKIEVNAVLGKKISACFHLRAETQRIKNRLVPKLEKEYN